MKQGKTEESRQGAHDTAFLAVELFATIAIALPRDNAPYGRWQRNQT
jgi:hypothetical protein